MRIDVTSCDRAGTGTGFLITPNLVATVWHVVEGADYVRVTDPSLSLASFGTVIGLNREHDMALIRLATPIPGYRFTLETAAPELGTDMAAIGFPLGGSIQITPGTITGAHSHRIVRGVGTLSDVLLTDAVLNPATAADSWFTGMAGSSHSTTAALPRRPVVKRRHRETMAEFRRQPPRRTSRDGSIVRSPCQSGVRK